jgi:molybdopterin molybdotransferase
VADAIDGGEGLTIPPLSVAEAVGVVLSHTKPQPVLRVPLVDAVGHILAEEVVAPIPLPPWTNAAMDGYAVRADDIREARSDAPVSLRVVSAIAAGDAVARALQPGEAARIFTGAPVPAGADSVVRQEDTDRGRDTVRICNGRDAGHNIRLEGTDLAAGDLALPRGTTIGPHQLALLASLGVTHPLVHRRPRVAVLGTGDEVVDLDHPEEIVSRRRLGNSNGPAIEALVRESGGVAVSLGLVGDDPSAIRERLLAAGDADLLITAGGVSVGDHDHLRRVLASLGATLHFTRVQVRPGGPTSCGVLPDGRLWIGLPGNPVSAMVTYELFARPVIRAMMGDPSPERQRFRVRLEESVHRNPRLAMWLRVRFTRPDDSGVMSARLTGPQGSGALTSVARSQGLIEIPAGEGSLVMGSMVTAIAW